MNDRSRSQAYNHHGQPGAVGDHRGQTSVGSAGYASQSASRPAIPNQRQYHEYPQLRHSKSRDGSNGRSRAQEDDKPSLGIDLDLRTSPTTSGFGDLLARDLDDIHARHSPNSSSPSMPTQHVNSRYDGNHGRTLGSAFGLSSAGNSQNYGPLKTAAGRTSSPGDNSSSTPDWDNLTSPTYSEAGIISMYAARSPSPSSQRNAPQAQAHDGGSESTSTPVEAYGQPHSYHRPTYRPSQTSASHDSRWLNSMTGSAEHLPPASGFISQQAAPHLYSPPGQPASYSLPASSRPDFHNRSRKTSMGSTVSSSWEDGRPAPSAYSSTASNASAGHKPSPRSASLATRPSMESNLSGSSWSSKNTYLPSSSPSSGQGVVAPRPSMSSEYSWAEKAQNAGMNGLRQAIANGRGAGGTGVRPLPVPEEESYSASSSQYVGSPAQLSSFADIPPQGSRLESAPSAHMASTGQRAQSDFARSFYHNTTNEVPARNDSRLYRSQADPVTAYEARNAPASTSNTYGSSRERSRTASQPTANTSAVSVGLPYTGTSPGSRQSSWTQDIARRSGTLQSSSEYAASGQGLSSSPYPNGASGSRSYASSNPSANGYSLGQVPSLPRHPPIHHHNSDPLYDARTPHSTPLRQNTYASQDSLRRQGDHTNAASSSSLNHPQQTPSAQPVRTSSSSGRSAAPLSRKAGPPSISQSMSMSAISPSRVPSVGATSNYGLSSLPAAKADGTPPPLPTSPSISISPYMHDTSFSSTHSSSSTASGFSYTTPASSLAHRPSTASKAMITRQPTRQNTLSPPQNQSSGYFPPGQDGRAAGIGRDLQETQRRRFAAMGLAYFKPALLSNIASAAKDRVARETNIKGGISFENTFTGEQLVSTVADLLPAPYAGDSRVSLAICRLLQLPMFMYEVEGEDIVLRDSSEQLFGFTEEHEQSSYDYLLSSSGTGHWQGRVSGYMPPIPSTSRETEELPNGVLTRFTRCYSPFCGVEGTPGTSRCYSLYCPNGNNPLGLQRKESSISMSPASEDAPVASDWSSTVSRELSSSLDPTEVKRQNNIYELIKGEHDFKADLDTLDMAFRQPLLAADPPVVHPAKLNDFVGQVFGNLTELRMMVTKCVNAYVSRQREESPVIQRIGDVVLDLALMWGPTYLKYFECQVRGDYLVNEERSGNQVFADFMESRRQAFKIRQDFRHYHTRVQFRLPRLASMLLPEILKHTPADHPDVPDLKRALEIIKQQCTEANALTASEGLKLACSRYDRLLERTYNYSNDLDLGHPNRQLFHHSRMFGRPEGTSSEWPELQVMLFDDFLLITRPRGPRGRETYRLRVKPIRLELLEVSGFEEPASLRTASRLEGVRNIIGREGAHSGFVEKEMFPIVFKFAGRESGTLMLYVEGVRDRDKEKDHARREWQEKLHEAIAFRKAEMEADTVFNKQILLNSDKLASTTDASSASLGRVNCSYTFKSATGRDLVIVGSTTGLWIGYLYQPGSFRHCLHDPVISCSVLPDFGMVLVQTNGRLKAYLLDALILSAESETIDRDGPTCQKISGHKDISFFKVGRVGERTLVVYAKKESVSGTSVIKAMEPIAAVERRARFLGMGSKKSEWFRLYKDGEVPTIVSSISFTRSKLALVCAPGFEILDIETLKTGSFPDWAALKLDAGRYDHRMADLQRRCQSAKAVGLFRISDSEFLFCYDSFAFFADRHGDPLPGRYADIVEWEGKVETVVYYKPFVLAIEPRFVEIRDLSRRGKLVQLIRGTDIRCSYDGQGVGISDIDVRLGGSQQSEERKPHIAVREGRADKIYELAPCFV